MAVTTTTIIDTSLHVANYEYSNQQSLIRERKIHDPVWEAKVRKKVYERVSWNNSWKAEPARREQSCKVSEQTFDQVFEKKVQKSVIGQFLEEANIPANREVREAMIEILEFDWKSYTMKQWKKFAAKNDFISNPLGCLARAILKNERINTRWVEAIATTVRLVASGITKIGKSLKRFKALHHLSLGGNDIEEIEGQQLPPDLRVLELTGNRISSLEKLVNRAPKGLVFLGLSRNFISNEHELQSLAQTLNSLKVLDLEDNDLKNLADLLEALKPLEPLRALILEGNPCSTCLSYKTAVLANFANLMYLDNVVVKPSDKFAHGSTKDEEKLSTGILFMHVYRIFHLEKPPPLKVDLPLLDAHLILREEMDILREEIAKTGIEFPIAEKDRLGIGKASADNNSPVTSFRTEEFEWKESLFFNEPALEMPPYGDELRLLSDTFKSIVTVRLVRQKFPLDHKKRSPSLMNIEVNERTEICNFTCALKNMSWADRSQDFSWTFEETRDNSATSYSAGLLTRQKYIQDDLSRRKKSTKSLHKEPSGVEKESKNIEPVPVPKAFTIHIGFGLRRFPDFDPIEISPPTKINHK